uniref:ATP synthase F0 subunit 8 n=1 Tax=Acrobeloides nanus TaxID=290746 RepID=A0A914E884_9BILA
MPKQEFIWLDYTAPVFVFVLFFIIIFILCITLINYCYITNKDDLTVFEKLGKRFNIRLGPHTWDNIRRGGYVSTYVYEQEAKLMPMSMKKRNSLASVNYEWHTLIKKQQKALSSA